MDDGFRNLGGLGEFDCYGPQYMYSLAIQQGNVDAAAATVAAVDNGAGLKASNLKGVATARQPGRHL